jgi:hypothetical protein
MTPNVGVKVSATPNLIALIIGTFTVALAVVHFTDVQHFN